MINPRRQTRKALQEQQRGGRITFPGLDDQISRKNTSGGIFLLPATAIKFPTRWACSIAQRRSPSAGFSGVRFSTPDSASLTKLLAELLPQEIVN
jgi:hypothetical protein